MNLTLIIKQQLNNLFFVNDLSAMFGNKTMSVYRRTVDYCDYLNHRKGDFYMNMLHNSLMSGNGNMFLFCPIAPVSLSIYLAFVDFIFNAF